MDDSSEYIVFFDWNEGSWVYKAVGDCCSISWFESINNATSLLDSQIIGIEIKPEKEASEPTVEESIKLYGYTLKTLKGYCDIEFRNSSNGYYGGWSEYIPNAVITSQGEKLPIDDRRLLSSGPDLLLKDGGIEIKIFPLKDDYHQTEKDSWRGRR